MNFHSFLESIGLVPPLSIAPGKWMRCRTVDKPRKKNGSFKLADDGRVGFAINYATMAETAMWRPESLPGKPEPYDFSASAARLEQQRQEYQLATNGAREYYDKAAPLKGGHPYLEKKGLTMMGCRGLRVDTTGRMIIPMTRNGWLMSVQTILPDGEKRFYAGAPVKGTHYRIERPNSVITILCEGLATGLTLFAAVQNATVIVAFTSGNMEAMARDLDWHGLCVVAADNDETTERKIGHNPGLVAATKAANVIGCGLAIPYCKGEGNDWNDYFQEKLEESRAKAGDAIYRKSEAALHIEALQSVSIEIMKCLSSAKKHYIVPIEYKPPVAVTPWRYVIEHKTTGLLLARVDGKDAWTDNTLEAHHFDDESAKQAMEELGPTATKSAHWRCFSNAVRRSCAGRGLPFRRSQERSSAYARWCFPPRRGLCISRCP